MIWSDPKVVRGIYGTLVREFGGVEAVAALLDVAKGTVSKQINGQAEIGFIHVGILEQAVGRFPLTDLMQQRRDIEIGASETSRLAETAMAEMADVAPAILRLVAAGDPQSLQKEGPEAISALQALIDRAKGGME